jgi:hypothetical protein
VEEVAVDGLLDTPLGFCWYLVHLSILSSPLLSISNSNKTSSYPLYNVFLTYYLQAHGANLGDGSNYQTYRDLAISSVVGIFGPLLSAYLVSVRKLKHQWSLFITSCICAIFAGLFTQVRTEAQNIAFSSMVNFWLNALYAVIYAYVLLYSTS